MVRGCVFHQLVQIGELESVKKRFTYIIFKIFKKRNHRERESKQVKKKEIKRYQEINLTLRNLRASYQRHRNQVRIKLMNVAFVIDNSISMNQRTYNGLSLLEIAKNGVEFIIKQRLRSMDSKYDTYQLFQTGFDPNQKGYPNGVQILSSYKHDISHLFFQLKNIKTHAITDLPNTLQNIYRQLNMFRYLNGADNVLGGRDPLKSDPSLVILFTDEADYYQLDKLQEYIRTNKLQNKWDQTIVVFELMLPSIIEKNILDQEVYRKQLQNNISAKVYEDIANALGGSTVIIDNYEYLFQVIDTQIIPIFNKNRLNIYLQISSRPDQESPGFIDSGIKEVINPISNPLLPSKDIIILKINAKLNKQFQQAKLKSEIQSNHNYSRILLPEKPAKFEDPKKPELMMNDYPKYIVDFSKIFHANMYKELEFERQELELSDWSRLISPQIAPYVKEKAYFPLYTTNEFKFNYEEAQLVLIGLLRISCKDGQIIGIDLLYNIWNFLEFNGLYDEIIQKKNIYIPSTSGSSSNNQLSSTSGYHTSALPQQVEQELQTKLERYFLKTPAYYWQTIRKLLVEKGLQSLCDHKFSFLYGEILQEQEEYTRNMQKFKQKERKKLDEDIKQNRFNHSIKKSSCCAPNSENYEFINRQMHPKSSQKVQLENLLIAKEEILFRKVPKIFDSIPQSSGTTQNKNQLYSINQPLLSGDQSGINQYQNNQQINSSNYIFNNPKLAKKFIKDDYIKRIHYKSEPVSKMSELLRSVKQQEYKDPNVEEDEIKCIKEPIPFGNPFKIIVRIKNSRLTSQQNELISSEENYINTNIHQGNKISQNLLTNRLPKLKKLKSSMNPSSASPSQNSTQGDSENSENDQRFEGEIRKKIKLSEQQPEIQTNNNSTNQYSFNNIINASSSKQETTSEDNQIYVVEKASNEEEQQASDQDPMIYDPTISTQLYENSLQADSEDSQGGVYSPDMVEDDSISQKIQQNNLNENTKLKNTLSQQKMDIEEYNPQTSYNQNLESSTFNGNTDSYGYDEEYEKGYNSLSAIDNYKKNWQQENQNQQKEVNNEEQNKEKDQDYEYTSDRILDYIIQKKDKQQNKANISAFQNKNNYEPSILSKKNKLEEQEQVMDLNNELGYNPDSDQEDNYLDQSEDDIGSKKSANKVEKHQIKKYIHNNLVYDMRDFIKNNNNNQLKDEGEEEYNPALVSKDNQEKAIQYAKIKFSTKYLISPYRDSHQFLLKNKNFFDNLLIIQKQCGRDELKAYVNKQMKQISDQKFRAVFKQRVSDIVYLENPQNAPNTNTQSSTIQQQQLQQNK